MARHGLLTQQASAPVPPPAPAPAAEEKPNASPEEQQVYDQFVDQALSAIYDDKSLSQVIEGLKGDGNPVDGLANTTVAIVMRVQDSAEKAGQALPPDVVFNAGTEVLEELAGLAEKAGVHKFTDEEVEGAMFQAMDLYREMKGRDGGTARAGIVEDFNQVTELDKAGEMDQVAPGLTERFGGGTKETR